MWIGDIVVPACLTHDAVHKPGKMAGTWHYQAIELVEEIVKRTTNITGDLKETVYLF